jgi:two-component system chemotaxis response regulator CheB
MTPHESPRPLVVAIGVSADGLAALQAVVGPLERVFPAAILIVRHVAPTAPGLGAKILGRATRIPVKEAMAGERLQPGVIYVAPPDLHLSVVDGALGLDRGPKVRFARPSIDVLFASVARVCGARSIGRRN